MVELAGCRNAAVADVLLRAAVAWNQSVSGGTNPRLPLVSLGFSRHMTVLKEADKTLRHYLDTSMRSDQGPLALEVGDS
jgi:hypothetical protein